MTNKILHKINIENHVKPNRVVFHLPTSDNQFNLFQNSPLFYYLKLAVWYFIVFYGKKFALWKPQFDVLFCFYTNCGGGGGVRRHKFEKSAHRQKSACKIFKSLNVVGKDFYPSISSFFFVYPKNLFSFVTF